MARLKDVSCFKTFFLLSLAVVCFAVTASAIPEVPKLPALVNENTVPTYDVTFGIPNDYNYGSSIVGDLNNDGLDDMVISAYYSNTLRVVYGSRNLPATMNVEVINNSTITSSTLGSLGWERYKVGDVNNDGVDDLLASSNDALVLVFGNANGLAASIDLESCATW